jgi:hypothetical protein
MSLPPAIERFSADVAGEFGLGIALQMDAFFDVIDLQADVSNHAGVFLAAIEWIVGHRERSILERIEMVDRLRHLKGFNVVNLREFTGWQ